MVVDDYCGVTVDGHPTGENPGESAVHQRSPRGPQVRVSSPRRHDPETKARCTSTPGETRCCSQWGNVSQYIWDRDVLEMQCREQVLVSE